MRHFRSFAGALGLAAALTMQAATAPAFVTFESGEVRPLAKSPDGTRLFVCNTPDNRLEIFDIGVAGLTHVTSVPVGLEPVAVAARTNTEIWVVNFLSDSVSIVDITNIAAPRVTRTLTVGDEPRDIVFGGPAFDHAFITTAHRGQNSPIDPQLTTEGVGRADVWVFDANDLGTTFGGDEETIITLFGDTPRALAVSPDGNRVYAAIFMSGNQTTTLNEGAVHNIGGSDGVSGPTLPPPNTNANGNPRPEVGLIVKFDGTKWVDELDQDRSDKVKFSLPDYDVFAIDASMDPPVQVAGTPGRFPHVGTTIFNMAVNPTDGKVFVSNLEAFNEVRFEGPGVFADTTVRGHLVESRITVIDPTPTIETVEPRHLNNHIDYNSAFDPVPNATNDKSLAFPLDMQFTSNGDTLYVAAFGSSKIGIYDTTELENDTFTPDTADQITLTGGGPAGIVLDEANGRLFVLTRFDNSVSTVNTTLRVESDHVALHNPEPASVVQGRPFLYNAAFTSSRGDQACASCHIFGDMDSLAWDLGNPDDVILNNPSPLITPEFLQNPDFHPMKGPMTTQSLRGMDNEGPMHWRGDRTGGNDASNAQPNRGIYDEQAGFKKFNPAFVGLLGRDSELSAADMQKFTDFILQVMYPPNPIRALDNQLTADEAAGQNIFFNRDPIDTLQKCDGCHVTTRAGNEGLVERPGFFGTDGRSTFENETQTFKVAHLRNLYQKVGMFGMIAVPFVNVADNGDKGDQVRGFGFLHDGSIDTVFRFFQATVFNNNPAPGILHNEGFTVDGPGDAERRQMEAFVLAFDSNHRPIVGQQVTLSSTSNNDADDRVDLMLARAEAGECDVVAKGVVAGDERGYLYEGANKFSTDRVTDGLVADATLRGLVNTAGQELTFTAVPSGEGKRIGVDRDEDGFLDGDEIDAGSDPTNADDFECTTAFVFKKASLQDKKGRLRISTDITLSATYTGTTVSASASDSDGEIFSQEIGSGSFDANSKATTYKYKAPKDSTGITGITIKQLKTPGQYRVIVKTKEAWAGGAADEDISTTNVTLVVAGECFSGPATKVN